MGSHKPKTGHGRNLFTVVAVRVSIVRSRLRRGGGGSNDKQPTPSTWWSMSAGPNAWPCTKRDVWDRQETHSSKVFGSLHGRLWVHSCSSAMITDRFRMFNQNATLDGATWSNDSMTCQNLIMHHVNCHIQATCPKHLPWRKSNHILVAQRLTWRILFSSTKHSETPSNPQ